MKLPSASARRGFGRLNTSTLWAPLGVLLLLAGVLSSLLEPELPPAHSLSSYGAVPHAWGAAYELLGALKPGTSRSRETLAQRRPGSTQWLIDPSWTDSELTHELDSVRKFAHDGATVLLIGADERVVRALGAAPAASPEAPLTSHDPVGSPLELTRVEPSRLTGSILPRARNVELTTHTLFDVTAAPGFEPRVRAQGGAFLLERSIGRGRLVLVASAHFLTNQRLGNGDNAPFLVDLSQTYGAPVFDERCHGFSAHRSLWVVLGPAFFCLTGVALLVTSVAALLNRRRWPLPVQIEAPLPPPTLEVFVSSLASLYQARGRRDVKAVFRAYRAGYMRRLQRLMFGQREVSEAQLEARVQRDLSQRGEEGRWLRDGAEPRSVGELIEAISALERYAGAIHSKRQA